MEARKFRTELTGFKLGKSRLQILPFAQDSISFNSTLSLNTLADLLSPTSGGLSTSNQDYSVLSVSERIRLAVDLASSFFYIFGTPWYRQEWSKHSVKLSLEDKKVKQRQRTALLERKFPDKNDVPASALEQDPQDALFRLSICLEELCFGTSIECLPAYQDFCGPDGKPRPGAFRAAAQELLGQIEGKLGFCYYDAVRKCLAHSILVDRTQSMKPEFWQQAHDDIVLPLEKVLEVWVSQEVY